LLCDHAHLFLIFLLLALPQDDFFESTPWRGAGDKRDTLFQDDDLELPLVGFLDAQTLKKGVLLFFICDGVICDAANFSSRCGQGR
jgi:hypothetical protein